MIEESTSTVEVTSNNSNAYLNGNAQESFEDLSVDEMRSDDEPSSNNDWDEDEEKAPKAESKKAKQSEDLKLLSDSDDSEDKPAKKAEKKDAKADVEEDDKESDEAKQLDAKTETEEKELPKSGKVKIRIGDDLYGLEPDTTVRVKVDGAYTDVPISKLVSEYSGKEAAGKRFSEIGEMKKEVEQKSQTIAKKEEFVNNVAKTVKEIVSDPSKDPYEAVAYLAELMGVPTPDLHKRSLEARLDELSKLLDMTDIERENYFLKKETDYLRQRQDARQKQEFETQESQKFVNQINQLRGKHNVSEEQFVEAMDELEQFYGADKLTPEFVVEYAVQKPYLQKTKDLIMPYIDEIGEAKAPQLIQKFSDAMRNFNISEEDIKAELEKHFGVSKSVKDINAKVFAKNKTKAEVVAEAADKLETFEDFEF